MTKKIYLCFMFIVMATFLGGCKKDTESSDGNGEVMAYNGAEKMIEFNPKFEKNADYLTIADSYYDDEYNYYLYELGQMSDVPYSTPSFVDYHAKATSSLSIAFSECSESSIEKTVSETISKTVSVTKKVTGKFEPTIGIRDKFSISLGSIESSRETTKVNFQSTTKTYSECQKYTESLSKEVSINLGESSPFGYYGVIYAGTFDIYGLIAQDKNDDSKLYYTTFEKLVYNSYRILYTENTNDFGYNKDVKMNDFDLSSITDFTKPTKYLEPRVAYYDSIDIRGEYKITDFGAWGFINNCYDEVDLSKLKKHFNEHTTFSFEIKLKGYEKDDGSQEIMIYNDKIKSMKESDREAYSKSFDFFTGSSYFSPSYEDALSKYGLVGYSIFEMTPGSVQKNSMTRTIKIDVKGNRLTDKMYIKYDATGSNDDTWYNEMVTVMVTMKDEEKPSPSSPNVFVYERNNNEIRVTDGNIEKQYYDIVSFSSFGFSKQELINQGYNKIRIDMEISMKRLEDYKGYPIVAIADSASGTEMLDKKKFEDITYADYETYDYSVELDISDFSSDYIVIRYHANGEDDDDWYTNGLKAIITLEKENN